MKKILKRVVVLVGFGLVCLALWGCVAGGIASKSFDISGDIETNTTVERTSE